jgi:NAD(P)-dependent dehydrogenase (short-subunit alcohol dehydrogenase family)
MILYYSADCEDHMGNVGWEVCLMSLADQVAIVTGGGSGLGRAMALGLAEEGAKILIAEVRQHEGEQVVEEIRSSGGTAELFVGDISQDDTARALIETCRKKLSGLDILINNAGLRMETHADDVFEDWRCLRQRPTHEVPIEEWDLLMGINLRAPYLCTHFALPYLIEQRGGTVINVSSDAGQRHRGKERILCVKARSRRVHQVTGAGDAALRYQRQHRISRWTRRRRWPWWRRSRHHDSARTVFVQSKIPRRYRPINHGEGMERREGEILNLATQAASQRPFQNV